MGIITVWLSLPLLLVWLPLLLLAGPLLGLPASALVLLWLPLPVLPLLWLLLPVLPELWLPLVLLLPELWLPLSVPLLWLLLLLLLPVLVLVRPKAAAYGHSTQHSHLAHADRLGKGCTLCKHGTREKGTWAGCFLPPTFSE